MRNTKVKLELLENVPQWDIPDILEAELDAETVTAVFKAKQLMRDDSAFSGINLDLWPHCPFVLEEFPTSYIAVRDGGVTFRLRERKGEAYAEYSITGAVVLGFI